MQSRAAQSLVASIAYFMSARDLCALLQTCARVRASAPKHLWRAITSSRFPGRLKCSCTSCACRNIQCPLCITCPYAPTDQEFALLLETREHARCFMLHELLRDVPPVHRWDGMIDARKVRVPLLRGDIIMVALCHSFYVWDGHYAVRARDRMIPPAFLIPTEFAPRYFAIYNHEIQFAFDAIGTDVANQRMYECGIIMVINDATYIVELRTTHKNIVKRAQRATVCRAQLVPDSYFRIIVDLDTAF